MKMLLNISVPNEPFNTLAREGVAGQKIGRIIEATKPEAIYFTTQNGGRGCVAVYNLENASDVPALCEPWFLTFNAGISFDVCMTPDDLGKAGLDQLGKTWG